MMISPMPIGRSRGLVAWDHVLDGNMKGAFFFAQAMIDAEQGGAIINIASIDALQPSGTLVHYDASKGGSTYSSAFCHSHLPMAHATEQHTGVLLRRMSHVRSIEPSCAVYPLREAPPAPGVLRAGSRSPEQSGYSVDWMDRVRSFDVDDKCAASQARRLLGGLLHSLAHLAEVAGRSSPVRPVVQGKATRETRLALTTGFRSHGGPFVSTSKSEGR
jgi:hypothetical protein